MANQGGGPPPAQIPTSFGHELRACLRCRLVKTYDQFRESGCENCPFFQMEDDHERVVDCTTPNFTGSFVFVKPIIWIRLYHSFEPFSGRFAPGCYTLAVSEALPHEMQLAQAQPISCGIQGRYSFRALVRAAIKSFISRHSTMTFLQSPPYISQEAGRISLIHNIHRQLN
ncbi:transcription elongation factor SPT4 homolog 1-like [Olea europaea subsp. europaea]|uniref:Transcription elongation factor SPT4 homolog 1-like n=1 Tax=Olea europaea subsp. europaea TaxID=158383 RepID=A0A8S0U267_OLEEU|nr:transcription elongation factor SPT4 homolog 1-like [Olea europaea subsp. europaea]